MEAPPMAMDVGFAVSVTVATAPDNVTVAVAIVLAPPAPLQTNEYDVVAVSAPVLSVPLVALVPLQPPEAVHEVALVELHVSMEAPPTAMDIGLAVSVTVAAALDNVTVAVAIVLAPPAPLQTNE
jgi:hypothetical protein